MSPGLTTILSIWAGLAVFAVAILSLGPFKTAAGAPVFESSGSGITPRWMKHSWPNTAIQLTRFLLAAGLTFEFHILTPTLQRNMFMQGGASKILSGSINYALIPEIILSIAAAFLLIRIILSLIPRLETYSIIWPEARAAVKSLSGKERQIQLGMLVTQMWQGLNRKHLAAMSWKHTIQLFAAGWIAGGALYIAVLNQYVLAGPSLGFSVSSSFSPTPHSYPFDQVIDATVEAELVVKEAREDKRIPKILIPHFTVKLVGGESIDLFSLRGQDGQKETTYAEILTWLKKNRVPVNIKPLSPAFAREFPEMNSFFTPLIEASKTVPARIDSPL